MEEIQQFLGVDPTTTHGWMVKIHNGPLNKTLENYNEVVHELQGTAYEWMLRDDKG